MTNDFIYHRKRVLPDKLCTSIIDFFEKNPNKNKGSLFSEKNTVIIDTSVKDSMDLVLDFNVCNSPVLFQMHHYLCQEINNYSKKFNFLDKLEKWKLDDRFNITKYDANQGFHVLHCEHGSGVCSTRIMAWMIYLNDVKYGGETYFPYQEKKFKPKRGDVLIWPSFWTHPHKGIVSKKEIKYIATGWISFI